MNYYLTKYRVEMSSQWGNWNKESEKTEAALNLTVTLRRYYHHQKVKK
jgi:hypothetical protein